MEEQQYESDHEYVTIGSELNRIRAVAEKLRLEHTASSDALAKDLTDVLDDFTDLTVSEGWN